MTLRGVEYVVFDEADRLFEMGFADQLKQVGRACRAAAYASERALQCVPCMPCTRLRPCAAPDLSSF